MIQKSCNVCSGVCAKQKQCVYTPADLGEYFATLLNRYQDGRLAIQCIRDEICYWIRKGYLSFASKK